MSGINSSRAWYPYNISSDRKIESGDVVLIELNVYADGYWSDITRTWMVGSLNKEQKEICEIIEKAINQVLSKEREEITVS